MNEEDVYGAQRPAISKVYMYADNNAQGNPNACICAAPGLMPSMCDEQFGPKPKLVAVDPGHYTATPR